MIAISAACPDYSNRAPVAFVSLLDFARFRIDRSEAELCEACNTINSDAARFCKGCNCKLPAYYATTTASEPSTGPARVGYPLARQARGFVLTMLWVVPMIAMLLVAGGLWLAGPTSAGALAVRTAQPFQALQPLAAIVSAAQPAAAEVRTVVVEPAPGDELAAFRTDAAAETDPFATPAETRAARRASPPQGRTASPRTGMSSPQASCGGLNFLSHAICMNSACAQPGMSRSAQCADALRQRKLDEARRNPTLVG
jgi:hypothetical protein